MRYLFFLEIAIAVLGASMVIGVGVSALLLAWHADASPEYPAQVRVLLGLTLSYLAATLATGVGAWAIHRKYRWQWLVHGLAVWACWFSYNQSIQSLTN